MRAFPALVSVTLLLSSAVRAQEDMPLPYSDAPATSRPKSAPALRDDPVNRGTHYSPGDDPATGLGVEGIAGLMLLDSTRGALVDPRFSWGARFTWDYGRLFSDTVLHDALFVDVTWITTTTQDGTNAVNASTSYHDFTIAPAFELPFGEGSPFGVFLQVGGGEAIVNAAIRTTNLQLFHDFQPLFQYGVGFRGRPLLSDDGKTRLTFRVEVTRFRRSYLDDTLILGSLGLAF